MKKALSLLLVFCVVLCAFAGCAETGAPEYPLTVNGVPLDEELFRYYLDIAFADPALSGKEARVNYATEQCIRYVAVNSAFVSRGLRLTPAEKAETSERANALWSIFGTHYKNVGVSKQAFLKVQTSLAYTERLREYLYGENGVTPLPEEDLQAYFTAYYVGFKVLKGNLYGTDVYGNRVEYTETQLSAVKEKYYTAARQINQGVAIDYTYASLISSGSDEVQQSLTTEVIADGDPNYPAGFYAAVRSVVEEKAVVMEFGDEIYLVYRVKLLSDSDLFPKYRAACLAAVSEPYLQNEINVMCNAYSSVRKTGAVQRCYEGVRQGRNGR